MSAVLKLLRRQRRSKRRAPARQPRWVPVLMSVLALAAVGAVGFAAREFVLSPWMRVRQVAVRGTERLTAADFRAVLGRQVSAPILLVDLDQVRAELEKSPGVLAARVARRLPDTLEALVTERRAIARASLAGRPVLIDRDGMVFSSLKSLPGDARLPEIFGLATPPGAPRLAPQDQPAVLALLALTRAMNCEPPEDTTVDLTPRDRIVLRPGHAAPALWLDRNKPERNVENLFAWKNRVAATVPGASVDLRFPSRLIHTVPAPVEPPEGDGTTTE
jgi:cell division protein FtsQ